jgi:hypothetical protein
MSTAVAEVTELDIDLEAAPPCEIEQFFMKCGNPSAFRVRFTCPCGTEKVRFICEECMRELRAGNIYCPKCHGTDYAWRMS